MFMTFILADYPVGGPDDNGHHDRQKICLNVKNINIISQSGHYEPVPVQVNAPFHFTEVHRGLGHTMPPTRELFIIDNDRFNIMMNNGQNWQVLGNFDEMANTLSNFRDDRETIG